MSKPPIGGRSGKPRPRSKRSAEAFGADKPASGTPSRGKGAKRHGRGYGGAAKGEGQHNARAEPITPENRDALVALAMSDEAIAKREARRVIDTALLSQQLAYALGHDMDPVGAARALVAEKVLDRFMGKATQPLSGDAERPGLGFVLIGEQEAANADEWAQQHGPK